MFTIATGRELFKKKLDFAIKMLFSCCKNLKDVKVDTTSIHSAIEEVELPVVKKFFFCFPLTPGIIVWGFTQLAATILISCAAVASFADKSQHAGSTFALVQMISMFILTMTVSLLEIINCAFLVYGAQSSNPNLLEVCFYYLIVKVPAYSLLWLVSIVVKSTMVSDGWYHRNLDPWRYTLFMESQFIGLLDIASQLYLLILVRSLILQLQHSPHLPSLYQRLKGEYHITRADAKTEDIKPSWNWDDYRSGLTTEFVPIHHVHEV